MHTPRRRILAVLVACLGMAGIFASNALGAASLSITPVTWDVVGLDSNSPGTGPKNFPVGAKVCNTGNATATGVATAFAWTTANANISLQSAASDTLPDLTAGACVSSYFTIEVNRIRAAFDTTRKYTITATATGGLTAATPSNRQIYVEHLVSQNRNTTFAITGAAGCTGSTAWLAGSGSINFSTDCTAPITAVKVGGTYTLKLYAQTSTTYEQVEPFVTFPGSMFRVESVRAEYQTPTGTLLDTPYGNACGWNPVVGSANYLSCTGPAQITGGKVGNRMIVTYVVSVVGAGSGSLQSLIYDFSGSSFHYNADFSTAAITTFTSEWPLHTTVTGSGTVTSNTGGINCGVTCDASYANNASVTLTATPSGGQTFTGWTGTTTGCTQNAGPPATITCPMNQARNINAAFTGSSLYYPLATTVVGSGTVTSNIAGIDCDPDCAETYAANTAVTLTATPAAGQSFIGWTGDTTGCTPNAGPPATLACTMDQARNITATFGTILRTLTVDPPVGATITGPGGINCVGGTPDTGTCSAIFPDGTGVTLTTTPDPGYRITNWTAPCAGTAAAQCGFTLSSDMTVGSTVASGYVFSGAVVGGGTITSAPGNPGVDCPGVCDYGFATGTALTVTPVPATGWAFAGWTGADCPGTGTGTTCAVTMSANRAGTATFHPTLSAAVTGQGTVTSSSGGISCPAGQCSATIPTGTSVTLTATPAAGWSFAGWTGDCVAETSPTCTEAINTPHASTALFDPSLTTEVTGTGTITPVSRSITCAVSPCTIPFGDTVTISATPGPGQVFLGWGGACSGTALTCTVTMDQLRTVTARFGPAPVDPPASAASAVTLSTAVTGTGSVSSNTGGTNCPVACSESFVPDAMVTLTATPGPDQVFTGWSGACSGTALTCTVTMSQSQSVGATFVPAGRVKLSSKTRGPSAPGGPIAVTLTVTTTGGPLGPSPVTMPVPPGTTPVGPFPPGVTVNRGVVTWRTALVKSGGRTSVTVRFRSTGSTLRGRVVFRPAMTAPNGRVLRAPAAAATGPVVPLVTG